jgi:ABC-2 type transport system permease protein
LVLRSIQLVIRKELQALWKDKRTLAMYFIGPTIIMIAIGSSLSNLHAPVAVVDEDKTDLSGRLVESLKNVGTLEIKTSNSRDDGDSLLHDRSVISLVIIPKGFTQNMTTGATGDVEVITDTTVSMISDFVELGIRQALVDFQKSIPIAGAAPTASGMPVEARFTKKYSTDFAILDLSLPSTFSFIFLYISMTMTSMSIVGERMRGTLPRLVKTPVSMVGLIMGKFLASLLTVNAEIVVILLIASQVYSMTIVGSIIDAYLAVLFTSMVGLSLGLLISMFAKSERQAAELVTIVLIVLIMTGGTLVPFEKMPKRGQSLSKVLPVYYSIDAIRSIFLRGYSIDALSLNFLVLGLYIVAPLLVAMLILRSSRS